MSAPPVRQTDFRVSTLLAFSWAGSAERVSSTDHLISTTIHPAVPAMALLAYGVALASFWIGFRGPVDLELSLVIVTFFLLTFLAVPWSLARTRRTLRARYGEGVRPSPTFRAFAHGHFDTHTGLISGAEAAIAVLTIPICLSAGAVMFAIVRNVVG